MFKAYYRNLESLFGGIKDVKGKKSTKTFTPPPLPDHLRKKNRKKKQ